MKINIDPVERELAASISGYWAGGLHGDHYGCKEELAWLEELCRLARLGAAVEEAYKLLDNHTVDETQFTTLVQTVVEQQEAT